MWHAPTVSVGDVTYKARLVSKGFKQLHIIDYDYTFALVEKMDSIRFSPTILVGKGREFHQMNVKNSSFHDNISKEIYMEQPQGFVQDSSLVCQLKKSLYGLM
jgi:hypothetical protein